MSNLHIYRASAGSGKTFTISREFIGLLNEDPEKYRHILAVTFTNKATAEMKGRILRELFKLASGQKSDYLSFLRHKRNDPEEIIRERAQYILNLLLHNYSHFTVTTIDSFFQKVIRSFAHELGLFSGFEVETDSTRVLEEAVEMLFRKSATDEKLRQWLVRFAENKIEDAKSWDLRQDILRLGKEIHKEIFKQIDSNYFNEILNRDTIDQLIPELHKTERAFEEKMKGFAEACLQIMGQYGLNADDFSGKSRSFAHVFQRISQGESYDISVTTRKVIDNAEAWTGKANPRKNQIESALAAGLNQSLKELVAFYDEHILKYNTVKIVFRNIYVLGIIADLIREINEYVIDKNIFLLADSTVFLKKITEGSDAPFIYEKMGSRLFHYMIDEFQDTSGMQWENFRPLLENSLAENYRNWLVGDVKQSIYRWRNSDWTILSDKIFQQFGSEAVKVHPLEYNWRSKEQIIRFNNTFFTCLRDILQLELDGQINTDLPGDRRLTGFKDFFTQAYNDCVQQIPGNHMDGFGYVRFEFHSGEDLDLRYLERLIETVEKLQDQGYQLMDIAILIRSNRTGSEIINYFMEKKTKRPGNYRYDVISNDALYLSKAPVVKWIIALMRFLMDPNDLLSLTFLQNEFQDYLEVSNSSASDLKAKLVVFQEHSDQLKSMPVYELVDKIVLDFALGSNGNHMPYLQSLQDAILQYSRRNSIDLSSFLNWWNESSQELVISMPENQDAMRLMTVHSSKGLEFKVVIIPFGDWDFSGKSGDNLTWVSTDLEPFDKFRLLPVPHTSALANTIFGYEYFREKVFTKVDNLNLLYVAFTRAVEQLIVFSPLEIARDETKNTGNLLTAFLNAKPYPSGEFLMDPENLKIIPEEHCTILEYGVVPVIKPSENILSQSLQLEHYTTVSLSQRKSRMVVSGEYRTLASVHNNKRLKGNLFHAIFQRIRVWDDIAIAVQELISMGQIPEGEGPKVINELSGLIKDQGLMHWFSDKWVVKNETDILLSSGILKRPDRILISPEEVIIVDYKFGEQEEESHLRQVLSYRNQMLQMGYKNVKAWIWYVFLSKTIEVKDKPIQGKLFE